MVRGQQRWWRQMTYQHGGGQDRAVLLKHVPPGFLGSLNFADAVCVRRLEMGRVGTWPGSVHAPSLSVNGFSEEPELVLELGESVSPPASSPGPAGASGMQLEARWPRGCCREVGVSLFGVTWRWESAPGIAVSSCQRLV